MLNTDMEMRLIARASITDFAQACADSDALAARPCKRPLPEVGQQHVGALAAQHDVIARNDCAIHNAGWLILHAVPNREYLASAWRRDFGAKDPIAARFRWRRVTLFGLGVTARDGLLLSLSGVSVATAGLLAYAGFMRLLV